MPEVKERRPAGSLRKAPSSPPPSRQVLTPGRTAAPHSAPLRLRCSPRCRCRRSVRAVGARAGARGASRPRRSAHPSIGCERRLICIAAPRPWTGLNDRHRGADGGAATGALGCVLFLRFLRLLRPLGAALGSQHNLAGGKVHPVGAGTRGWAEVTRFFAAVPVDAPALSCLRLPVGSGRGGFPNSAPRRLAVRG